MLTIKSWKKLVIKKGTPKGAPNHTIIIPKKVEKKNKWIKLWKEQ